MRVEEFRTFAGPNVYSHRPVLLMRLDLEDLTEKESFEIPNFVERLPALLPGLSEHHCSRGRAGGFLERLREGTYAGHVVEHVAIELMQRAGVGSNHGKTRYAGRPGLYNVAVEYKAEEAARRLLAAAVEFVEAVIEGREFPVEEAVAEARRIAARTESEPSTSAIVGMPFPDGAPSRVPVISVTGTNGKTTVTRMIAHLLSETGLTVGMTTTDGIYLGGELIVSGDTTGPHSARTVLGDPATEVAVLETARGGIVRRGLGYDWSDVAVLTNVSADHIGQDGIESVEDLLWIKSLVAERVREGGTLVLNADDELVARLPEQRAVARVPKKFVYFSLDENNAVVRRHLAEGGTAFFARGGWLVEAVGETLHLLVEAAAIPATMGGTADFQVANALAAAAAARAHGLTREQVAAALRRFRNDAQNPGRANLYRVRGGHVLVDYGHNPEAFAAVCRMAARWEGRRLTGIVGVPGDRDDSVIEEAGRVAARGFHRVIVKEDRDLRGRQPGEVASLLCRVVKDEAPDRQCEVMLDEVAAFEEVVGAMGAGDVVFLFYDKLGPALEVLARHGAVSVSDFETVAQTVSNS